MDFQRVLQQSFLENAPKQSDAVKQTLEQGENFQKTMAGERGIMAAIESAHLRPKIQNYLKGKLNTVSSDDVLKTARNIGTRLTGKASTVLASKASKVLAPREAPLVTENKVLAGGKEESGLVREGGFISRRAPAIGPEATPLQDAARQAAISRTAAAAGPIEQNPFTEAGMARRMGPPVRQASAPAIETPSSLGLPGEVEDVAAPAARAAASAARVVPSATAEELSRLPTFSPGQVLPTVKGSVRAIEKPTPEPSVPSASTPAAAPPAPAAEPEPVAAPPPAAVDEAPVGPYGSVGNPLRGSDAPPPPQSIEESFPSVPAPAAAAPVATPEPVAAAPAAAPAAAAEDEQLAARTQALRAAVKAAPEEEEEGGSLLSSAFSAGRSILGPVGTALGIGQALFSKGLSGSQRFSQLAQVAAPQAIRQGTTAVLDKFGLPAAAKAAGGAAGAGAGVAETAEEAAARIAAKTVVKTAAVAGEEASVPGVGDILALGTAIFGAVRGGIEAHKASKEVKDYQAPATASVAIDNAASFDSSFR